ncbi:MAG: hypothetical protein GY782_07400 [Gammaproteobacteria bacterium]|nr:hypothetical protein [Gammaproteobacteria bacterium]
MKWRSRVASHSAKEIAIEQLLGLDCFTQNGMVEGHITSNGRNDSDNDVLRLVI